MRKAWLVLLALAAGAALAGARGVAAETAGVAPQRIVAVGDVHGSPEEFSRILRAAGVIDEGGNWVGGSTTLVQTGDLMDRGAEVREVLDLMRDLERKAEDGGGRLVALLGNHEAYNLVGFYDYQSTPIAVFTEIAADFATETSEKTRKKAYRAWTSWTRRYRGCETMNRDEWMTAHPPGFIEYQEALSPRGEYGRWLRDRSVVASVGDTLFLHGGLSPALVGRGLSSLEEINDLAATELAQFDRDRELLEDEGVALGFSTLGEIYCALAHELQPLEQGSLPPRQAERRRRLQEVRNRMPASERWFLLDPEGPVWFRGYARWTDEDAGPSLDSIFATYGGRRVVVGHTPKMGEILERFDGRVFLIDTAMAYPEAMGKPAALEIVGDRVAAIYESGRVDLAGAAAAGEAPASETVATDGTNGTNGRDADAKEASPPAEHDGPVAVETVRISDSAKSSVWLGPDGEPLPFADDEEILDFLRTAEILDSKYLGKGVTRPKKLLLEKDGIRAHAVFHNVEETRERHRLGNGELVMFFRDSYKHNVAAYELGRLLGMANVPPAVVRTVDREEGSVQFFIEDAIDEGERKAAGEARGLPLHIRRQVSDMWVFDNLVNNIDRNQGNMLFDSQDGFWLIDHTRTFARAKQLYAPDRVNRCSRKLLAAIEALDEDVVTERLRPFLTIFEIRAIFKRREKLLDLIERRVADEGEAAILFQHGTPDDQVKIFFGESEDPALSAGSG